MNRGSTACDCQHRTSGSHNHELRRRMIAKIADEVATEHAELIQRLGNGEEIWPTTHQPT